MNIYSPAPIHYPLLTSHGDEAIRHVHMRDKARYRTSGVAGFHFAGKGVYQDLLQELKIGACPSRCPSGDRDTRSTTQCEPS
jgi:hypothetical protein